MAHQVIAVRVVDPGTDEQHITHYKFEDGQVFDKEQMLASLEFKLKMFYTLESGVKIELIQARSASGNYYVKTDADGFIPNNLLSLPRF